MYLCCLTKQITLYYPCEQNKCLFYGSTKLFSPSFFPCVCLSPPDHPEVSVRKGMECHEAALGNPKQPLCKYYLTSPIEVQQPAC